MAVFDHIQFALTRGLAALTLAAAATGGAQAASDPLGVWINDTGRGAVEIKRCGKALCGHVVWVKDGKDTKGCGKQIIGNATPAGPGVWDGGWIYSPERRKTYDVELKPLSNGTLRVTGYAGVRFLSKTMIWKRAPDDLQRCGSSVIEAKAAPKADESKPSAPAAAVAKAPEPEAVTAPVATPPAAPVEQKPPVAATTPAQDPAATPPPASAEPAKPATPPPAAEASTPAETPPGPAPQKEAAGEPKSTDATSEPETPAAEADADASSSDEEVTDNGPPTPREKPKLALGDIDLDKVLTRTKSGRCKLDLPFVKVQFDCNRD